MYDYLRHHPDVFMPYRKEPVYFGSDLAMRPPLLDEAGYLALFEPAGDAKAIGEARSGTSIPRPLPHEIKAMAPDARIIIMLRNPVEQMYSYHSVRLRNATEDLDFEAALAAEADRREGRRLPRLARNVEILSVPRGCQLHRPGGALLRCLWTRERPRRNFRRLRP